MNTCLYFDELEGYKKAFQEFLLDLTGTAMVAGVLQLGRRLGWESRKALALFHGFDCGIEA